MNDDPENLRTRAMRLFGMAIQISDIDPNYSERLVAEAIELQDRATAMEREAPTPDNQQQKVTVQQQEQTQSDRLKADEDEE